MALNNRCYLCGEKLRRGVCTACGLDNVRMTRRTYRLNETTPMNVKQQQVAAQKAEQIKYAKAYKTKQNTLEDMGKPLKQNASQKKKITYNSNTRQKTYDSSEKKSGKWTAVKVVGIVYAIFAAISALGSCVFEFAKDLSVGIPEYVASSYEEEAVGLTYDLNDQYAYIQRELSETGDYFEKEFGPGYYQIGVHIPEGAYTIQLQQGTYGNLYLDDDANSIYMSHILTEDTSEDYYYKKLEDVRLYDGAYLEIQGDVRLNFISENAQTSAMYGMKNPMGLSAVATLSASGNTYLVGEDIPAGVYDICAIDGWTSVWVSYTNQAGDSYNYYYWIDSDTLEDCYQNVLLIDGMSIVAENSDITLTPSEWIVTDDYETYFHDYFF